MSTVLWLRRTPRVTCTHEVHDTRQHTHTARTKLEGGTSYKDARTARTHNIDLSYYKHRDTLAALDLYSTARATACLRPLALPLVLVHSNVRLSYLRPDDQRLRSQDCPHPTHTHAPQTTYRPHHTHTHIVMRAAGCPPCSRLTGECPLVPYPCCLSSPLEEVSQSPAPPPYAPPHARGGSSIRAASRQPHAYSPASRLRSFEACIHDSRRDGMPAMLCGVIACDTPAKVELEMPVPAAALRLRPRGAPLGDVRWSGPRPLPSPPPLAAPSLNRFGRSARSAWPSRLERRYCVMVAPSTYVEPITGPCASYVYGAAYGPLGLP